MNRPNVLNVERVRDILDPFASPRVSSRRPRPAPRDWPEQDRMTIEVDAGDWLRLCVLVGQVSTEYLRGLPTAVRPSIDFIQELERLEEATELSRVVRAGFYT